MYRSRPIIVELHPGFIVFRVKGMRSMQYSLSYEAGLDRAIKVEAFQATKEHTSSKPRKVSRGVLKIGKSK